MNEIVTSNIEGVSRLAVLLLLGHGTLLLAGVRNPNLLAGLALPASGPFALFAVYSLDPIVVSSFWRTLLGVVALATAMIMIIIARHLHRLPTLPSLSRIAAILIVPTSLGFFSFPAMINPDSAQALAIADQLVGRGGVPQELKRGLLYPVFLAQGPEGFPVVEVTVVIVLSLAVATHGLVQQFGLRPSSSWSESIFYGLVTLLLLSTPIVQYLFIYINAHGLFALYVAVIVAAVGIIRTTNYPNPGFLLLAIGGGSLALVRPEGFAIALGLMAVFLAARPLAGPSERLWYFVALAAPLVSAGVWFLTANSPQIPLSRSNLASAVVLSLVLIAVLASSRLDAFRPLIPRLVGCLIFLVILLAIGGNPSVKFDAWSAQARNFFLGAGGWGISLVALMVLIVVVFSGRTSAFSRRLVGAICMSVAITISAKLFDGNFGGFGQMGFNDSLNRSYLHWLPIMVLALVRGFSDRYPFIVRPSTVRRKLLRGSEESKMSLWKRLFPRLPILSRGQKL